MNPGRRCIISCLHLISLWVALSQVCYASADVFNKVEVTATGVEEEEIITADDFILDNNGSMATASQYLQFNGTEMKEERHLS